MILLHERRGVGKLGLTLTHRWCLVLLGVLSLANPALLKGQQAIDTVLFVHGLGQGYSSWIALASDLAAVEPLVPVGPTLPTFEPYGVQAASLASWFATQYGGTLDDLTAISHSNGGVVVREYVRNTGTPKVQKHLTLGTPHLGARLAQRAQDGTVGWYMGVIAASIANPIIYYSSEDPDWADVFLGGTSGFQVESWGSFMNNLLQVALPVTGFLGVGYLINQSQYAAVLPDMWPTSSTISTLNASTSLTAEAQKVPMRVSISTQYPSDVAPFRLAEEGSVYENPDAVNDWLIWGDLVLFALEAEEYYSTHPDWNLRANAWRWADMYTYLSDLPYAWEAWTDSYGGAGDGIVGWYSSDYPGAGAKHYWVTLATDNLYVFHTEQLDAVAAPGSDPFREKVRLVVEQDLGIHYSAPPLSNVTITGPAQVRPNDALCNWWGSASGGGDPYAFAWSGVLSGQQETLSGPVSQSGWLYLTVTSGPSQGSTQLYVTVNPSAEECSA